MVPPFTMVMGIVLPMLGVVMMFSAIITPLWRKGQVSLGTPAPGQLSPSGVNGHGAPESLLFLRYDGLWESCLPAKDQYKCWDLAGAYRRDPRLHLTRGLVLTALFFGSFGSFLVCVGFRCWADMPAHGMMATGSLLVALAGLLNLAALSVYTHNFRRLGAVEDPRGDGRGGGGDGDADDDDDNLHAAESLYVGWMGAGTQLVGSTLLLLNLRRPRCRAGAPCPTYPEMSSEEEREGYEVSCIMGEVY